MRVRTRKYVDIASDIARINDLRTEMMLKAFALLELHHPSLARMLLQNFDNRRRAAHWMCMYQRIFNGKSAYDVLAEGDEDSVWDEISRIATRESTATLIVSRSAY
ncbi:MAG: DUF2384 domain-containing protein [Rhodanobacter sp.]